MHNTRIVPTLLVALLPAACVVGPQYSPPDLDAGTGWAEPSADNAALQDAPVDLERWWTIFDDPTLTRLIETALAQNLDVREASARVREARALRDAAAGRGRAVVEASAGVTRLRQSENGPLPINQIPGIERDQTIYEPGFDAAWEIDVFGGSRRAVEAAAARVEAALERARGAQFRVAAETARGYLELRGVQHELDARRSSVTASQASVDLVRRQFDFGEVPEAAVAQAEAELAVQQAELPLLESRLRAAALSIGILLGDLPESELGLLDGRTDYAVLASLPVGQRADLLRRRPDVRAAERALAAATADVGTATANLFPKIGIGGGGAFQSLNSGNLFESASERFAIAPLISWRVFDGGRVRAEIRASEARVEVAALEYEKAVKEALTDAELALTRYNFGLAALDRQAAAVAAARRSHGFAAERYGAGDISLLELLDAERVLRRAEDGYARAHTQAATQLVAVFKALGGGWESTAANPLPSRQG